MALTAKFLSDFSRFFADVQKATGMLGNMQTEADQVASHLDKVPGSMKDIEKSTFDWKGAMLGAASAVGVAFSVNAVKNFALGVIDAGAKVGDLSVKLGISAEAVQRFGYAAEQSGTDIDTVGRMISFMNKALAEGNKSTVAALAEVGINFAELRRQSPEDAFITLGDAAASIVDPMQRAAFETLMFGKAGEEGTQMFLAGIRKVGEETSVMSEETIARLKRAQDAWARLTNAVKIHSGEIIADTLAMGESSKSFMTGLANFVVPSWLRGTVKKELNSIADVTQHTGRSIQLMAETSASAAPVVSELGQRATFSTQVFGTYRDAVKEAADAQKKFIESTKAGLGPVFDWQQQLALTKWQADQLTVSETQLYEATATLADFVASHQGEMFPEPPPGSLEAWERGQQTIVELPPQVSTLREDIGLLASSFADLGQIGGKGLSDVTRGLGTLVGATNTAFGAVDALKKGFTAFSGGGLLSGLASLTTGIGGIVAITTAAISGVKLLWNAVAGASEESKKVSPMRDEFFRLQGGLESLNPRVQALEGNLESVQAVFDAKTVQQYDAAIANLNRILAQDTAAFNKATEAADDYANALRHLPNVGSTFSGGGGGETRMVPGFAGGTHGQFVDFGAGTLAMLHGREAIVPAGAAGPVGGSVVIQINAQGAFFDTPGDLQRLAEKVNEALTAKYGLTNRTRAA